MRRVAAEVCPAFHGVLALRQEIQVCPVGIVHQQQAAKAAADLGKAPDIRHIAQVIRAGDVYCRGRLSSLQESFQLPWSDLAGQQRSLSCRIQPIHLYIQQRGSGDEHLVGIPPGGNAGRFSPAQSILRRQINHGPDGQGRALRRVNRPPCPKEPGGIALALQDDPGRVVQHVRPGDLGDVQPFRCASALMPRHVKPDGVGSGIAAHEIADGSVHSPLPSSALVASTMMAHSIRLRNSSQPYLYTPVT